MRSMRINGLVFYYMEYVNVFSKTQVIVCLYGFVQGMLPCSTFKQFWESMHSPRIARLLDVTNVLVMGDRCTIRGTLKLIRASVFGNDMPLVQNSNIGNSMFVDCRYV